MTIINENIAKFDLIKPSNFAKLYLNRQNSETARKYVYELIGNNKITVTQIDGVKFIVLDIRTQNFIKHHLK